MAQIVGDGLQVHEITIATSRTLAHLILAATGFVKIGHRRQVRPNGLRVEPPVVQICTPFLGVLFITKLDVSIASQVFTKVVADVHLFDFAVLLLELDEKLLENVVEMLLLVVFEFTLRVGHRLVHAFVRRLTVRI